MAKPISEFKIKPSNVMSLKMELDDSGYYFEFDPQPDITPYETALVCKLVLIMIHAPSAVDLAGRFMRLNKLQRHFTKTNEVVEDLEDEDD